MNNNYLEYLAIILIIIAVSCKNENTTENTNIILNDNTNNNVGVINKLKNGCNFNKNANNDEIKIYKPQEKEYSELKEIVSYTGIPLNFEIYEADINNAIATIIDNKRYILYDTKLLNFANNETGNYWSSISILAHEIGHHLSGHTLGEISANNHIIELEADKFSGFVLYKMGATLEQATKAIKVLGDVSDSESHPNRQKRIKAIEEGWNESYSKDYNSATPPPLNEDPNNFYEYTMEMLYDKQFYEFYTQDFFKKYDFNYGVVTDNEIDKHNNIENVSIEILRAGNDFVYDQGSDKSIITIWVTRGEEMCNACWNNLPYVLKPGRRVKFSYNEGHPEGGSMFNGVFHLSYLKAISSDELDFYVRKSNNQGRKKIIRNFLIAEEERNFDKIKSFYSKNLKRYWNLVYPKTSELRKQYENAWSNSKYSQNLVQKIEKINYDTYVLKTKFKFFDTKKLVNKNIESKVLFRFDSNDKILETFGIK